MCESKIRLSVQVIDLSRLSLISAAQLAYNYTTAIAYSRPVHTTITALAACVFLIVSASKAIPNLFGTARGTPAYTTLPLHDLSGNSSAAEVEPKDGAPSRNQSRVRITVLAATTALLSVRLELYRQISKKTECTVSSLEIYLPLLLACYDAVRFQSNDAVAAAEKPDGSVYEALQEHSKRYILGTRFRYILPAGALCFGCRLLLNQWIPLNSTYICPVVLKQQNTIPSMQAGSLLLDFLLAVIVYEMLPRNDGSGLSPRRSVVLWTSTLTGAAAVWSLIAAIVYIAKPEYRIWLLLLDSPHFFGLLTSIIFQSLLFSIFCIATLHSVGSPNPLSDVY